MADTPTTSTDNLAPAVATFAARWADFSKAFAIYPLTNVRVQKALDLLLDSLEPAFKAAEIDPEIGLQVLFSRDAVRIGKMETPLTKNSLLSWLDERIQRTALAGLSFLPGVTGDAIAEFTHRLLKHFKRKDLASSFEELWPIPYDGLLLIDRRFEGYFDDTTAAGYLNVVTWGEDGEGPGHGKANREVAKLLSEDGKIEEQLEKLKAQVNNHDLSEKDALWRRIDILPRIVQLLPHDALQHYDQAVMVTVQVVENLADRLARTERGGNLGAFADDSTLNQLIYATSRGIFGRRAPSTEEIAKRLERGKNFRKRAEKGKLRSGRASDAAVEDSLELLQEDIQKLPEPYCGEMSSANSESHDEQLGVYLHVLVRLDEDEHTEEMKTHIADLLESAGDRRLSTLKDYLETTSENGDPGYRRLIDIMCERGLQGVLRTSGFLEPAKIVRGFPRYFGLYLEAMDPKAEGDLRELEEVCAEVGTRRIRESRRDLIQQEGILEAQRAHALLSRPSKAVQPLLRLILAEGGDEQRVAAVSILRRLRVDVREACLLYIWEDPVGLPLDYLLTIADPERSQSDLRALRPKISHQICRFLSSPASVQGDEQRRIYAIHHLGMFGGREAEFLLRSIIRDRHLVFLYRESKAVREAAAHALASMQSGRPRNV